MMAQNDNVVNENAQRLHRSGSTQVWSAQSGWESIVGRSRESIGRKRDDAHVRPTLRDVAAVAGVSFKTVARVINGEPGVRPETASRVMVAVRELGFRRNVIASEFAKGGSRDQIGLVIDDVSNPFYATIARAIEDVAATRGLQVVTASSDFDPQREHHIIGSFVSLRLRGLLIVPIGRDHRYLAREMRHGTAIVFLDRPQRHLRADTVLLDDYGGARAATEHLLVHGHRRIAVLSQSLDMHTMSERFRGYREALADASVELDEALVRYKLEDAEDARDALLEILALPTPPTAVFCANNRMTVGAIRTLRERQVHVAMVGFDELELADALATPLTVVRTDAAELGRQGAELLLKRMDGWAAEPQRIVLPTELIERGSGELLPS